MAHAEPRGARERRTARPRTLDLTSSAFADGARIPERFTADGDNSSPPLKWSAPPAGTASFALVCQDPDAPSGLFVHWLAWGIGLRERGLDEDASAFAVSYGFQQGRNGFGRIGWSGPAPPHGKPHRYVLEVYALDAELELEVGATREELQLAMAGHVLAEGRLTGRYGR